MIVKNNPKVAVLISTYNGDRFLSEQINSILQQKHVDVSIFCRDDGSEDTTKDILKNYLNSGAIETVFLGKHVGAAASYFELIGHVGRQHKKYDLYALADQDDVWELEKLWLQYNEMRHENTPALCYCGFKIIDDQGRALYPSAARPIPSFSELLLSNDIPGCTLAFNAEGMHLLAQTLPPASEVFMHDWWSLSLIAGAGRLLPIDRVLVGYRQHRNNAIGPRASHLKRLSRLFRLRRHHPLPCQVGNIRSALRGKLSREDQEELKRTLAGLTNSFFCRLSFVLRPRSPKLGWLMKVLIVLGYFRASKI